MEKISILMPNYNRGRYVRQAVASCLAQTYPNFELLIADSSTDGSMEILREFENEPRVTLYHRDAAAWRLPHKLNFLLGEASGEYIRVAYSDDLMKEDSLNECRSFARKHNLDFVTTDHDLMNSENSVLQERVIQKRHDIQDNLTGTTNINQLVQLGGRGPLAVGTPALFGRTECVRQLAGWDENFLQEDVVFLFKVTAGSHRVGFINRALWQFRTTEQAVNEIHSQGAPQYFRMRIHCMRIALESGKLDKPTNRLARLRIRAYGGEIFQSRHQFMGYFPLFFTRYHPKLVWHHLRGLGTTRRFFVSSLVFIWNDWKRRNGRILRGAGSKQTFY